MGRITSMVVVVAVGTITIGSCTGRTAGVVIGAI